MVHTWWTFSEWVNGVIHPEVKLRSWQMRVYMKKDGTGWDPGSTECAVRKCAGKGNGSLENQKSTASWKVSEDKVSRRSSCVQFYRETEGSQD